MLRVRLTLLLILMEAAWTGCGSEATVIPTGEFTEEQKKAIQAEDAQVAEQESGGKIKKKK